MVGFTLWQYMSIPRFGLFVDRVGGCCVCTGLLVSRDGSGRRRDRFFMLQFNCKTDCYIYENIRMNVYLTKQEDGNTEACDMLIKFLDLDDDSFEYISYDTWLPSDAVSDNTILDYLLEELTLDVDILDPDNVDLVVLLNGTMSFHRSRRLENNNDQPLIEFV